jgi:hypothetical protein
MLMMVLLQFINDQTINDAYDGFITIDENDQTTY